MTYGYKENKNKENDYGYYLLPEGCPKILTQYKAFRVFVREDLQEAYGNSIPVIPLTKDIISKSLKKDAENRDTLSHGELIVYLRYEPRFNQYIFRTQDSIEIQVPEAFLNKKFLFPINLSK